MGRQAKLKKQRKQAQNHPVTHSTESQEENNPQAFVKHLEKEGYSLKETQKSPEIPDNSVKPQI
ncbi:MAG: hypothetical protein WBA77_02575 [Microcoleaceae cyanobacterium]